MEGGLMILITAALHAASIYSPVLLVILRPYINLLVKSPDSTSRSDYAYRP